MTKENVSCYAQRISLGLSLILLFVLSACSGISIGGSSGNATPTTAPTSTASVPTAQATSVPTEKTTIPDVPTPTSIDANSLLNTNLITNGDAEAGPGTNNAALLEPIPGWTRRDAIDVQLYASSSGGSLALTDPGPSDRGNNYFTGGVNSAQSSITQTIDISAASALLSQGNIQFTLSAWLGGWESQDDNARLSIQFVSASGQVLSTASVGPVLAAERHNATGLIQHSTAGKVPGSTVKVLVTLTITREAGGYNDGSADDLSLMFHL